MKINAIDYGSNVVTKLNELFSPLELMLFVTRAKGDVMHRSGCYTPNAGIRHAKQVNDSSRRSFVGGCEAKPVSRFFD